MEGLMEMMMGKQFQGGVKRLYNSWLSFKHYFYLKDNQ